MGVRCRMPMLIRGKDTRFVTCSDERTSEGGVGFFGYIPGAKREQDRIGGSKHAGGKTGRDGWMIQWVDENIQHSHDDKRAFG